MKATICALLAIFALSLVSVPAAACERECDADGKKYSHGAKWNGQRCKCEPFYGKGEPRTGPPAYYNCDWE